VEWATVTHILAQLDVPAGAAIIDVGSGSGWTSLFLGEAGYHVQGYDLVPANVDLARQRAARWSSSARFDVADMEDLPSGDEVDAVLIFDSLHHSASQGRVLRSVYSRIKPGGWVILGEPTWLHRFSPGARATTRDLGWLERGLSLRTLRGDLRQAGFGEVRRFFQPTMSYERRVAGLGWQALRLVAASLLVAPQSHWWLAARAGGGEDRAQPA